ncbi:uncharacterized protein METZ01_LOCUS336530, partial [marine metagenome]
MNLYLVPTKQLPLKPARLHSQHPLQPVYKLYESLPPHHAPVDGGHFQNQLKQQQA